jgi:hypothetical protein
MLEFDVPGIKSEKCAATIRGAIQGVDRPAGRFGLERKEIDRRVA